MSIEILIQRLIDSVDANTQALIVVAGGVKDAPEKQPAKDAKPVKKQTPVKVAQEEPKQEAKPVPTVSKEQIGKAIAAALAANQREGVVATLKQFGASNASTVQEDDYEAVLEALNSLLLAN